MIQRRNSSQGVRDALFPAAAGFFAGLALASWFRIYNTMFPINVLGLPVLMYALAGFPAGAAIAGRKSAGARLIPALAAGTAVFAACAVVNQNFTTHYLLGKAYYPYPLPERAVLRIVALAATMLASPLPFLAGGRLFAEKLSRTQRPHRACAALALGAAAGGVSGFVLTLHTGPYLWLLAGAGMLAIMLPAGKWRIVCAVIIAASMVYSAAKKEEAFYVWRVGDYKKLSTRWTTFYRVDFISFDDGRCLGAVYNTLMVWYVCPQVDMLPAEVRMIISAVGKNKKRALIAGRTDGMYAQIISQYHPNVKEVVSVEYDPVVAEKMAGEYARYNNYIFRRPGFSARAADIRNFLENERKQYDLIFLNGVGIGLFYFPGSIIRQEDYLTGAETYNIIFNRLLKDDGVFVIDWGSSREVEAIPMMANAPPGVHTRAYWFTVGQYPLVGLPLFFVFASRSEAELDRISRELETMPTFQRVEPDHEDLRRGRFGDDQPFHNYALARLILFASGWFALGIFIAMRVFIKKARAGFSAISCFSTSGLTVGMIAGMVMIRNPRFFTAGAGVGVAGSAAALALGAAAGAALGAAFGKGRAGAAAVLTGLALGAVCVWDAASGTPGAAAAGALLVGFMGSLLWSFGWGIAPAEKRPAALAASWLGAIVGVYLCQFLIFCVGFGAASGVMALNAALSGLYCMSKIKKNNSFS